MHFMGSYTLSFLHEKHAKYVLCSHTNHIACCVVTVEVERVLALDTHGHFKSPLTRLHSEEKMTEEELSLVRL